MSMNLYDMYFMKVKVVKGVMPVQFGSLKKEQRELWMVWRVQT